MDVYLTGTDGAYLIGTDGAYLIAEGISFSMPVLSEQDEIAGIVNRLLDNMALSISSRIGRDGILIRQQIGDLRSFYIEYLEDDTFATKLLACFTSMREANVKLSSLTVVHDRLFLEIPSYQLSIAIVQVATGFCLAAESRMITGITFTSRDDVEAMMKKMKLVFDTARDLAADENDSASYQQLTYLAGALIAHLANVARPLPRMVTFKLPVSYPALTLSNRVYYTGDRSEELIAENKIVHPAFCQREIRGLAS